MQGVKVNSFLHKNLFAFISTARLEISSMKLTVSGAYIPVKLVHLAKPGEEILGSISYKFWCLFTPKAGSPFSRNLKSYLKFYFL